MVDFASLEMACGFKMIRREILFSVWYAFAVGARYWFTETIGANLEAGYGLSFLKAGVTFKF